MKILAIDQSTTSTSGFLFDMDGPADAARIFHRDHRQHYPAPGHVEHDPAEILTDLRAAMAAGRAAGADALALTNQGESCLAWDAETRAPLSPILVWQDNRTEAFCKALATDHADTIRTRAGLPVEPYFSAPKMRWLLDHLPSVQQARQAGRLRLGTTDAWFRHVLTGLCDTDIATASRTSLLNLATGAWDPTLCAIFGVPMDSLPRITANTGALGSVDGLPLTAAIVDQQAAMAGHGLTRPGDTKITFGTGAFALTLCGTTPPSGNGGALPTIAWQEDGTPVTYARDGGLYTASAAVTWARELGLFGGFHEIADFDGPSPMDKGLVFVPALSGLACPHWDLRARGCWLGLSLDTSRADMMRALLDGIAYRTDQLLRAMACDQPLTDPIRIDGGMSANPWFCQALADITGRQIAVSALPDLTAFGAARLAARHVGQDLPAPAPPRCFDPDPAAHPNPDRFAAACDLVSHWADTGIH